MKNLSVKADFSLAKPLIISNLLLSALGGLMWYLQFFFYAWGHASIPAQYDYMSWMLHMSFYVLCGGLVGLVLKEVEQRRPSSGERPEPRLRGDHHRRQYRRSGNGPLITGAFA